MIAPIPVSALTEGTLEGTGIFDVLMRVTKVHLEAEYVKNRIKGPEYSTVYLGSLESVMRNSMDFLLQRQKAALEAELMAQQVLVAQAEVEKMAAEVDLAKEKVLLAKVELEIMNLNKAKIPAEIAHLEAQTQLLDTQRTLAETKSSHEIDHLEAQTGLIDTQRTLAETKSPAEIAHLAAQTGLVNTQKTLAETKSPHELAHLDAQTALVGQQKDNAVLEGTVLVAQECKLRAEYDVLMASKDKTAAENALLVQKNVTEKAQTISLGVDADSVIGKQKALYQAQTDGFSRDAEQKAAKLMVDSWNVRRTTDEGTVADGTNMLADVVVGRAVNKMLTGVGA